MALDRGFGKKQTVGKTEGWLLSIGHQGEIEFSKLQRTLKTHFCMENSTKLVENVGTEKNPQYIFPGVNNSCRIKGLPDNSHEIETLIYGSEKSATHSNKCRV